MIKGVAFVAYPVTDVLRAAAFYRDVLGLQPGESFNESYAEFNVGSTAFAVDGQPPGYEAGSANGVSFEVDDIAAARDRLTKNKVSVTDVYEFPTCSACFAKDPDGNGFALHQRKNMSLHRTIPVLRIFDVSKAREFYLDYLGFNVDFEHRFHDNAPLFMGISRDGITLFLSEHHGDGTPGTHVVVDMSGLENLHGELQAKHYRYMNPDIQQQEWGSRELCVVDPFNNRIVFSERIDR